MSAGPSCPKKGWRGQRGVSLLEIMLSLAVLGIGVLGLARMNVVASTADGQAARLAFATGVAEDLLTYLRTVPLDDPALDGRTQYDDLLDEARLFNLETLPATATVDHDESSLPAPEDSPMPFFTSATTAGRPSLDVTGDGRAEYERFWRIAEVDVIGPDGTARSVVGLAVIVRWREPATRGFRRVVLFGTRYDESQVFEGTI